MGDTKSPSCNLDFISKDETEVRHLCQHKIPQRYDLVTLYTNGSFPDENLTMGSPSVHGTTS